MTNEDMEQLSMFVVSLRNASQSMVDACNLFLNYLETVAIGVPQDPAIWDTLEWEQRESDKGFKYEMLHIDENNQQHRQLRILIKREKRALKLGHYRYSLGRDEKVIFRNILKEKSAK